MTIHKPITPHETQDIFDGRIFSVSVEAITLPGGGRLNVELVRHPGSVVIIAVAADETLLLVRKRSAKSPRASNTSVLSFRLRATATRSCTSSWRPVSENRGLRMEWPIETRTRR